MESGINSLSVTDKLKLIENQMVDPNKTED